MPTFVAESLQSAKKEKILAETNLKVNLTDSLLNIFFNRYCNNIITISFFRTS